MRPHFRKICIVIAVLAGVASAPSIASAAEPVTPTTSWGVEGLLTGTQTDSIQSPVFALERIGNTLYVGGRFLRVTNGATTVPRSAIAAFNATTGEWISTFSPQLNGAVYALQASPDGSTLFVGGDFRTVNGQFTGALAALDPATGGVIGSWQGRVGGHQVVRDLDVADGFLYAGGGFTSIAGASGGAAAYRVGRFNVSTGAPDLTWLPQLTDGSVWGIDVSTTSGRVYLGGNFKTANGAARPTGFAVVSVSDGANVTGINNLQANVVNTSQQFVFDVLEANGKVFVAGSQHYLQVLDQADLSLEVFHRSSPRGDFQTVASIGSRVYAGSHSYGGTTLASARGILWVGPPPAGSSDAPIFARSAHTWTSAFDSSTGLHQPAFLPSLSTTGGGVWAIEDGGDGCIWFGGAITSAASQPQYGISRLCETDTERPSVPSRPQVDALRPGEVDLSWTASTDNIAVTGYRLYNQADDTLAHTVTTNSTTLNLEPGTYTYYLRAIDDAGNVSWRTGPTTFTVPSN